MNKCFFILTSSLFLTLSTVSHAEDIAMTIGAPHEHRGGRDSGNYVGGDYSDGVPALTPVTGDEGKYAKYYLTDAIRCNVLHDQGATLIANEIPAGIGGLVKAKLAPVQAGIAKLENDLHAMENGVPPASGPLRDAYNQLQTTKDRTSETLNVVKVIRTKRVQYVGSKVKELESVPLPPLSPDWLMPEAQDVTFKKIYGGDLGHYEVIYDDAYVQLKKDMIASSRAQAEDLYQYYQAHPELENSHHKRELSLLARDTYDFSNEAYNQKDYLLGDNLYKIASGVLDLALGLTPGVSWAKDLYEASLGINLVTGEALTPTERAFAILGVATAGVGSKLLHGTEVLGKVTKIFSKLGNAEEAIKTADKIIDSAKNWDSVQSLIHVTKGNYQIAADGTRQLVSGMHTKLGFDNFLKLNQQAGKNFGIQNVTEFTVERIEAGGAILSQTLENGVRKVQLPRDAWANADAFSTAMAYSETGQKLKGVKTLWPDSFDLNRIAEATNSVVTSNHSARDALLDGVIDGVKFKVRIDGNGKVITSYPAWKQ